MDYRYTAIILGKRDIGEADRMYFLYTLEAGKIDVVARGVRRSNARLAGNLEPLTKSLVTVARGRGRGNVTGVIAEEMFPAIKSDFERLRLVFSVFRLFSKIISDAESDSRIFALLETYLNCLEKSASEEKDFFEILTLGFTVKFLSAAGYTLEVARCVACGKALQIEGNVFRPASGGVLDGACAHSRSGGVPISGGAIKLLRLFLSNRLENLGKIKAGTVDIRSARRAIDEMTRWIIS